MKRLLEAMPKPALMLIAFSALILSANLYFHVRAVMPQEGALSGLEAKIVKRRPVGDGVERVRRFKATLPLHSSLTASVEDLFDKARASGLSIASGNYVPEAANEAGISRYSVSFPVSGRYSQLKEFLYKIESSDGLVTVEDVRLKKNTRSGGTITLDLKVSVYFRQA